MLECKNELSCNQYYNLTFMWHNVVFGKEFLHLSERGKFKNRPFDFNMAASSPQRTIFLLTYSQADLEKFPTRQSFADVVVECFTARNIRISMWVTSLERHKNGGFHYHMAVKLCGKYRWLRVRKEIFDRHCINVNFNDDEGDSGNTYYTAYKYVVKHDSDFVTSVDHPEITALPRADRAIAANRRRAKNDDRSRKRKRDKRMTDYDLLQIIPQRKFTSRLQMLSLAAQL